jgi:hypothetical protein
MQSKCFSVSNVDIHFCALDSVQSALVWNNTIGLLTRLLAQKRAQCIATCILAMATQVTFLVLTVLSSFFL